MYWKHNNASSPQIEAVLNREDLTLQILMEEEDILQELKNQNKKLIEFLLRPEVMDELVTLTTTEPSTELPEKLRYKNPNMACEILTSDVPALNERLGSDASLLGKLHFFLESDPPLNSLLASYLSKILIKLVSQRAEQDWYSYQVTCLQVLEFLKSKANFVTLLVRHLGTSAIMDLMLKLITNIEGAEIKQNILNWLDSEHLVQSLVNLLTPSIDSDRQSNAAQLLSDIIGRSRDPTLNLNEKANPDPILGTLESSETITLLLNNTLDENRTESTIVSGIEVLLALLNFNKSGCNDTHLHLSEVAAEKAHRDKVIKNCTVAIICRLKDYHSILLDPPKKDPIHTTVGILNPPFGKTRLHVCKVLAALLAVNSEDIKREISRLGIMNVLLDLFFHYSMNNFLHTQVQNCLEFALVPMIEDEETIRTDENVMYTHLFVECRLLERILEAWEENEQTQAQKKGVRKGYMGHLTKIANNIVDQWEKTCLGDFISANVSEETITKWNEFVAGPLSEINQKHQIVLGGVHPSHSLSSDNQDEFSAIDFPTGGIQNSFQPFADFRGQGSSSQFIEGYSYSDLQATEFEKACSEKGNSFDYAEDDDDLFEKVSDSNIEISSDTHMETSNWPPQIEEPDDNAMSAFSEAVGESSGLAPVIGSDPWATNPSTANAAGEGWANFDDKFDAIFSGAPAQLNELALKYENTSPSDDPMDIEASLRAITKEVEESLGLKTHDAQQSINPDDNANISENSSLPSERELVDNVRTFLSNNLSTSDKDLTGKTNVAASDATQNIPDLTSELCKKISQVELEKKDSKVLADLQDTDTAQDLNLKAFLQVNHECQHLQTTALPERIPITLDGYVTFLQKLWLRIKSFGEPSIQEITNQQNFSIFIRICILLAKAKLYFAQLKFANAYHTVEKYSNDQLAIINRISHWLPDPLVKALNCIGTFRVGDQNFIPILEKPAQETESGFLVFAERNLKGLLSETKDGFNPFLELIEVLKLQENFIVECDLSNGVGNLTQVVRFPYNYDPEAPSTVFYMNTEVPDTEIELALALMYGYEYGVKKYSRMISSAVNCYKTGRGCHSAAKAALIWGTDRSNEEIEQRLLLELNRLSPNVAISLQTSITSSKIPITLDGYVNFIQQFWLRVKFCTDESVQKFVSQRYYNIYVLVCITLAKAKLYYAQSKIAAFPSNNMFSEKQLEVIKMLSQWLPEPLVRALDCIGVFKVGDQTVIPILERPHPDTPKTPLIFGDGGVELLLSDTSEEIKSFLQLMSALKTKYNFIVQYDITTGLGSPAQAVRFPFNFDVKAPKLKFYINIDVPESEIKLSLALMFGYEVGVQVYSRFVSNYVDCYKKGIGCQSCMRNNLILGTL